MAGSRKHYQDRNNKLPEELLEKLGLITVTGIGLLMINYIILPLLLHIA